MSTLFSSIYTKANILFEDTQLLQNLTDAEMDELLEIFLSRSMIYFKSCQVDLNDIDDTLKQFNNDLSNEEQFILAEGIRLIWLERKLFKEENLRNKVTTKDYNSFSGGNLIDKLATLRDSTDRNLKQKIVDYSFNEFFGFN